MTLCAPVFAMHYNSKDIMIYTIRDTA